MNHSRSKLQKAEFPAFLWSKILWSKNHTQITALERSVAHATGGLKDPPLRTNLCPRFANFLMTLFGAQNIDCNNGSISIGFGIQ